MTRPTVLDMDLIVVPRESTNTMDVSGILVLREMPVNAAGVYEAMLSASPYPTAWDDVRKYVEKLEVEAKCDEEYLDLVKDKYRAAESRIAELEKRLADADRVIEPFAAEAECYDPDTGDGDDILWATPAYFKIRHLRAARAYMEGK